MAEKYFLGCMTQQGFSTEFGRLMNEGERFTYILKGGAGTGKSSLMKKIADEFEETEHVVRFCCSSDPDSLDAVMLETSGVMIVDGTSPHVFDPVYPAVRQCIVNLGDNWDTEKLMENTDEIIAVTDKNKSLMARAKRFSGALSNVCSDSFNCAAGCVDEEKLSAFLVRFYKKILLRKGTGSGRQDIRQLSALTEYGYMTMTETLEDYPEVFFMRDDNFACAHLICEKTAAEASKRGIDTVICPCHLLNNTVYEHILIPETGVALVSATPVNKLHFEGAKPLSLGRFYDKLEVSRYRSRLKMNRLTALSLADEVYMTIAKAKTVHDEIEKFYIEAMDFEKLDILTANIINEIRQKN